jgi:hypothetical protein
MKQFFAYVTLVLLFVCTQQLVLAQNSNTEKAARKESKKLEKEGWTNFPGSQPMTLQIEKAWDKENQTDERGNAIFIHADGSASGKLRSAAEAQALELAKLSLAGLIESKLLAIIETNLSNIKTSQDEKQSLTKMIQTSKNTITTKLGYVDPVVKLFRIQSNGDTEVQVRIFYNLKQTLVVAKEVLGADGNNKLSGEQLDKLLTLN